MKTGSLSIYELEELYEALCSMAIQVEREIDRRTKEGKKWLENTQRHKPKPLGSTKVRQ